VEITTFDGPDPYLNVNEFVGDVFKDKDPDYQWLVETKQKLDSMPAGQYLSKEEHNEIVQRQTDIQYKDDVLNDYYNELEENQSTLIRPHSAVEFSLESYCLNVRLHTPASGSLYDEVVPAEDHIKSILQWYYTKDDEFQKKLDLQLMIWAVQNFVHNGDFYEEAISGDYETYLNEIFNSNAKSILEDAKVKYGSEKSFQKSVSKQDDSIELAKRESYLLKEAEIFKAGAVDESNKQGFFYLGNGLIGRFLSKSAFSSAILEVINNSDASLEFKPSNFMLKQKGKSDYQPIAIGSKRKSYEISVVSQRKKLNQSIDTQNKFSDKPICNITEAHRQRIIETALPSEWEGTPYAPKNSKGDGVVCNQYIGLVYSEVGLDYPEVSTWSLPNSVFFEEINKNDAKDGDVVLWLNNSKGIHHMGIWVEEPTLYGGSDGSNILSAREHDKKSKLPVGDPAFVSTVDWTKPSDFKTDYKVYKFKGAGDKTPNCPLK